jgi:PLP dependent protein
MTKGDILNLELKNRYNLIVSKIRLLQNPDYPVRIISVSKGHSSEKIEDLYKLGQRDFAESYLDEMLEKVKLLKSNCPKINWIYVGGLQSNKIKKIVELAQEIHSISSHKHIRYAQKYAALLDKKIPVFISLNPQNEANKKGADLSELEDLAKAAQSSTHLKLQGIMVIPNKNLLDFPQETEEHFAQLKKISTTIGEKKLSLGMSQDFESAIKAGASEVRIGQAIFGPRKI